MSDTWNLSARKVKAAAERVGAKVIPYHEHRYMTYEIYLRDWWVGTYYAGHIQQLNLDCPVGSREHFAAIAEYMAALAEEE